MHTPTPPNPQPVIGVCLDLNIWVADLLAAAHGRTGTAAQTLVDVVRDGSCSLGPTQLIVSWGMLNRLQTVLAREFDVPSHLLQTLINGIATIARKGPSGTPPYLLLGGTGVLPLRDEEDRGVLEAAYAGRARLLVTHNLKDFVGKDVTILLSGKIAVARRGDREVIVVVPNVMLRWIRTGAIVLPVAPS